MRFRVGLSAWHQIFSSIYKFRKMNGDWNVHVWQMALAASTATPDVTGTLRTWWWETRKSPGPKTLPSPGSGTYTKSPSCHPLWSSVSLCIKQKSAYMTLMMTCGHHTLTCDTWRAHLVSQKTYVPRGAFRLCWKEIVLHLLLLENVELPARTQKSLGYVSSVVLVRISFLIRGSGKQTNVFSS